MWVMVLGSGAHQVLDEASDEPPSLACLLVQGVEASLVKLALVKCDEEV